MLLNGRIGGSADPDCYVLGRRSGEAVMHVFHARRKTHRSMSEVRELSATIYDD